MFEMTEDVDHEKDLKTCKVILDVLLISGADPKATNISDVSCLHLIAWYNLENLIDRFIKAGCKVNSKASDSYKTRWNMSRDSTQVTLLPRDCDLYRNDLFVIGSDVTPLYIAARNGSTKIVQKLIKGGADVNTTKVFGMHTNITALHAAAAKGCTEVVKVLLQAETNVNIQASDGGTSLHCAAEFGNLEVVRALLEHRTPGNTVDISLVGIYISKKLLFIQILYFY